MADPRKFFSVRENGIGQLNVSIKPQRVQEVAEAIETIIRATAQTNKSEIVCDALIAYAASLRDEDKKVKR
jgi:hypothetical protein